MEWDVVVKVNCVDTPSLTMTKSLTPQMCMRREHSRQNASSGIEFSWSYV